MNSAKHHSLSDVFGTSRDVPKTYVQRSQVDDRFLHDITRDKHIVVHGSSKQGKTCLRKFHLEPADYVLVHCTRETTKASLFAAILKQAGIPSQVSESVTVTGNRKLQVELSAGVGVSFLAKAEGKGAGELEKGRQTRRDSVPMELDPEDPNDLVRVLEAAEFGKYIVLEDFHYLDEEVQRSLAIDLKVFHEISRLVFIVVGVWLEANRLTLYNGDLTGRVAVINADQWSADQLREVVSLGSELLNVGFCEDVVSEVVGGCQNNVGLLQEVCYRMCEHAGVVGAEPVLRSVGSVGLVQEMLRAVADEQSSRYRNFLGRFAEGLGTTQLEMYRWIGYAVVTASGDELRRGMRPNVIFQRIRPEHPAATLQQNNVGQALERVGTVQYKHKLQPLVFDYSNGELVVVDANFLVFMQTHSKEELLGYLGFVEPYPGTKAPDKSSEEL